MATNRGTHPPLTAVALSSKDAKHVLEFVLVPLHDGRHADWHSYEIHMKNLESGRCWSLVSAEHMLFLDKVYEPEVPAISASLKRAVEDDEPFTFTPADERDFILDVAADPDGLRVRLQFDFRPAPSEFGWPNGVLVDRAEAHRFAESLEATFKALES